MLVVLICLVMVVFCDYSILRNKSAWFPRRPSGSTLYKSAVLWIICIHVVLCIVVCIVAFCLATCISSYISIESNVIFMLHYLFSSVAFWLVCYYK